MSRKGRDETVSVSASFRCSLMGECDTDLEFCLSKDSIGAPKVGIDHRWKVQGEFESRVRAKKIIHVTVARYSRDRSATFMCEYFNTLVAIESSYFSVLACVCAN